MIFQKDNSDDTSFSSGVFNIQKSVTDMNNSPRVSVNSQTSGKLALTLIQPSKLKKSFLVKKHT